MSREATARQPLCADIDGFGLHAAVRVEAHDCKRLKILGHLGLDPQPPPRGLRRDVDQAWTPEPGTPSTEGIPRPPGVTRSRHGAVRDKGHHADRQPQAPCEPGRSSVRSSPRRVGTRLTVPFEAVDGCARPGSSGGVGSTQGLLGLKCAFEFPMRWLTTVRRSPCDVS